MGFRIGIVFTILFILASFSTVPQYELEGNEISSQSGNVANINIIASSTVVSADRIIQFTASLTDTNGQATTGGVEWTSTNGTIEETGLFFPWSTGIVTITATHGSVTSSLNVTVVHGWASSISIDSDSTIRARNAHTFSAVLYDSKGNPFTSSGILWEVDGQPLNIGNPLWIPAQPGTYSVSAYYQEIQANEFITVIADVPSEFVFPEDIVMRSGGALQIVPELQDAYGYPMNLYASGTLNWEAESGIINGTGWYFPQEPGVWNVSVRSSGNITGNGTVRVLPADAALLTMQLGDDNSTEVLSGESYDLKSIMTDSLGNSAEVIVPLENWTIPSGEISWSGEYPIWTPNDVGRFTLSVQESGLEVSLEVNVSHGIAQDIVFLSNEQTMNAGDDVLFTLNAIDSAGNTWPVNGTIEVQSGETIEDTYFLMMRLDQLGDLSISGSWINPMNNQTYSTSVVLEIYPGDLALITLEGNAAVIPADETLDLDPKFFDGYGNSIEDIELNWTVDGIDSTLQLRLSDAIWYPETIGGHEIIANADGVFASIRLNVVSGSAYDLSIDADDDIILTAGTSQSFYFDAIDVYGNNAAARNISTSINSSIMTVEQSNLGPGWWDLTGYSAGDYVLPLTQDSAEYSVPLQIIPGNPIRILVSLEGDNFSQGDKTLLSVSAVDSFDNEVSLDPSEVDVECTSGKDEYVTGNTWEIDLNVAGRDRKCTIGAEGLVAQYYFEVDNVLFNGLLGSSNTAVGLISVLLIMILAVLIVLIKKGPKLSEDKWVDEEFDREEFEDDEESGEVESHSDDINEAKSDSNESEIQPEEEPIPSLDASVIEEKKKAATETGVMQAINPSDQGKTGWYVDASGEIMKWEVTDDGGWNRLR